MCAYFWSIHVIPQLTLLSELLQHGKLMSNNIALKIPSIWALFTPWLLLTDAGSPDWSRLKTSKYTHLLQVLAPFRWSRSSCFARDLSSDFPPPAEQADDGSISTMQSRHTAHSPLRQLDGNRLHARLYPIVIWSAGRLANLTPLYLFLADFIRPDARWTSAAP